MREIDTAPRYQAILDDSFRKHIAEWDSLSQWDPLKVLAESLSGSLAAIEARQDRLVSTLIDSLPSLLAFEIQPARFPGALVALTPSAKLKSPAVLEAGTALRFVSDAGTVFATLEKTMLLEPIADLEISSNGSQVRLRFEPAAIQSLLLTFIAGEAAMPCRLAENGFHIRLNETRDFTRTGSLKLEFPIGTRELVLDFDRAPQGTLHCNVATVELFSRLAEVSLGALSGEAWEILPLPESLRECPGSLLLRFPDEQTVELTRESDELLRLRGTDPSRFAKAFFYNPTRHAVIIPAAAECLRGYQGGVTVQAHQVRVLPAERGLPYAAAFAGDFPKLLQGASPLVLNRAATEREAADAYLARFYSLVREIPARARLDFFPEEICLDIRQIEPRVRKAEFTVAAGETIFHLLLGEGDREPTGDEETEIIERVRAALSRRIPLGTPFQVRPFYSTRLVCSVNGAGADASAIQTLAHCLQPFPIGDSAEGAEISSLRLEETLRSKTGTASQVRLFRGEQAAFVSSVRRRSGERFRLEPQLDNLQAHYA